MITMFDIPNNFNKNGYTLTLLDSDIWNLSPSKQGETVGIALYKQHKTDSKELYEVHIIRYHPLTDTGSFKMEEGYHNPSNNEWGRFGWTYEDKDHAMEKYLMLRTKLYTLPSNSI